MRIYHDLKRIKGTARKKGMERFGASGESRTVRSLLLLTQFLTEKEMIQPVTQASWTRALKKVSNCGGAETKVPA